MSTLTQQQQQQQSQAKPKPKAKASPFQLSDSEDDSNSDSDDDGISGLSIGTRRSSQALAELVFQSSLTSSTQETAPQHFPDTKEIEPVAEHVSSINPRYSSTRFLSNLPVQVHFTTVFRLVG